MPLGAFYHNNLELSILKLKIFHFLVNNYKYN